MLTMTWEGGGTGVASSRHQDVGVGNACRSLEVEEIREGHLGEDRNGGR